MMGHKVPLETPAGPVTTRQADPAIPPIGPLQRTLAFFRLYLR